MPLAWLPPSYTFCGWLSPHGTSVMVLGKDRGQQRTHTQRKPGWKTSRSCGRSTALWKACTQKASRPSRRQWVPNTAGRKGQPSLRCPLVCLHEKKSLNCPALDRDVQCATGQFTNSCEVLCETPRILKAAGSIPQKRRFHFQNWSQSQVGKNVFRHQTLCSQRKHRLCFQGIGHRGDTQHRFLFPSLTPHTGLPQTVKNLLWDGSI